MKKIAGILAAAGVMSCFGFELGKSATPIWYGAGYRALALEAGGYLSRVFGVEFPVRLNPKNADSAAGIYIGVRPSGLEVHPDPEKEYCVTVVKSGRIFLFGRDDRKLNGTAFTVYEFLEKYAGIRWLWPGELGTVVEKSAPVTLPDGVTLYQPPFDLRMVSSYTYGSKWRTGRENRELAEWLRHRQTGAVVQPGFQHAFAALMPRTKYGKAHPEYYSLVTPEMWVGNPKPLVPTRTGDPELKTCSQLCTSNPEVRRIIAEKIAADTTGRMQSVSPNDGFGFCECAECKKQDLTPGKSRNGHPDMTNRMYNFLSDIAHRVKAKNPRAKIGMFSYSFFDGVPEKIAKLPDNVYLSMCYMAISFADPEVEKAVNAKIRGLAGLGAKIVGREYWGTHYFMDLPVSHSRKIAENLKLLKSVGAAGIYGETGHAFCNRASDLYILGKLAWNPDLDREALLRDFCAKAFGAAGSAMFDYFETLETRHMGWKAARLKQPPRPILEHYPNGYAERHSVFRECFDAEFRKAALAKLRAAKKLARTPEQKARVDFFTSGMVYTGILIDSITARQRLAAAGVDMSLTQPASEKVPMSKAVVLKVASDCVAAENRRLQFLCQMAGQHALSLPFRSDSIELRPWKSLAEIARIELGANQYNFLVNGAFEYRGYEWSVKPLRGKASHAYVTGVCHDERNNYMVSSHAHQGISLELTLEPGAEVQVESLRPVLPRESSPAGFSMWLRHDGDPLKIISARLGQTELKLGWVNHGMVENHWNELRAAPFTLARGEYRLTLRLVNPTPRPLKVNLDNLRLIGIR